MVCDPGAVTETTVTDAAVTPERPTAQVPVVGQREPCPCGSGKRYKMCHGRAGRAAAATVVLRPYRGLPAEPDWVALREIVPAATAGVVLRDGADGAESPRVTVASALPGGQRALRRDDGQVVVALRGAAGSGDASRHAAAALQAALTTAPGEEVLVPGQVGRGPRLQDLLDVTAPFEVVVHQDDSWSALDGDGDGDGDGDPVEGVVPTVRLDGVEAAYWAQVGVRRHLRWVLPEDEQPLLDALARLHVAGALTVGGGSRYLGAFRACGLLVPVWDLAPDAEAADLETPTRVLRTALDEALSSTQPLDDAQRRARAGVVARQVTLR